MLKSTLTNRLSHLSDQFRVLQLLHVAQSDGVGGFLKKSSGTTLVNKKCQGHPRFVGDISQVDLGMELGLHRDTTDTLIEQRIGAEVAR